MSTPIHVLLLFASSGEQVGGLEQQVILQANTLAQLPSLKISVLGAAAYAPRFDRHIDYYTLPLKWSRNHPALLLKLYQKIHKLHPDLIHSHGHKAASLIHRMRRFVLGCPWIATAHGTKKQNRMLRHAQQVIAVSQGVQQALHPLPSTIIPNAVAPYLEARQSKPALCEEWGLDPELPLLIAVGRLAKVKGFATLMQAARTLPLNLLIFGDGPEKDYLSLRQTERIRLAGHDHTVRQRYSAADALVISSEREGHSLSMIEALQAECPVLSTPVSGAKEWLPASCLINADTPETLAECLRSKVPQLDALKLELQPFFDAATRELSPEKLAEALLNTYHAALNTATTPH